MKIVFFLVLAGFLQAQSQKLALGASGHGSKNSGYEKGLSPGVFAKYERDMGQSLEVRVLAEATREKKHFLRDGHKLRGEVEFRYKLKHQFGPLLVSKFGQQRNSEYRKSNLSFGGGVWAATKAYKFELGFSLLATPVEVVSYNRVRGVSWEVEASRRIRQNIMWHCELGMSRVWFFTEPGASRINRGTDYELRFGPQFVWGSRE